MQHERPSRSAVFAEGEVDDLPMAAHADVNVYSVPYNRREGSKPALDLDDIDAIVAFLKTLTDEPSRESVPPTGQPSTTHSS